jgi:hypothetical protein
VYINSPGGQPYSIIGVVDTMQAIKPPIKTVAIGACYSYASLLVVRRRGLGAVRGQGGGTRGEGRAGRGAARPRGACTCGALRQPRARPCPTQLADCRRPGRVGRAALTAPSLPLPARFRRAPPGCRHQGAAPQHEEHAADDDAADGRLPGGHLPDCRDRKGAQRHLPGGAQGGWRAQPAAEGACRGEGGATLHAIWCYSAQARRRAEARSAWPTSHAQAAAAAGEEGQIGTAAPTCTSLPPAPDPHPTPALPAPSSLRATT